MHWIEHIVRHVLAEWGYWAVLAGLLAEDAGFPVPGETVLMFAAFIAHKTGELRLQWVIVIGIVAAVAGDNLGFWLGHYFGKTFIRWVKKLGHLGDEDIAAAKDLIRRHGGRTIFFSRFIFGLRTIAGPLAGSLEMEWKRFLKFNILGAAAWVTAMAWTGYAFANAFQTLLGYIEKASWVLAGGVLALGWWFWRRYKKSYKNKHQRGEEEEKEAA